VLQTQTEKKKKIQYWVMKKIYGE